MQQHDDEQSVRYLVELGYIDPNEIAACEAAIRQQQQVELRQATDLTAAGRLAAATGLLEKLASDDPNWIAPRRLLAEIHYRAGRFDAAQAQLDWLTFHGVEHPRLALIAGAIALSQRELRLALEALEYAAYVEPKLPNVNTLRGTVLLRLARFDEAANAFREAKTQKPADARALDGLATVCLKEGQLEQAADWALQAIEQDPKLFRAHYHLGLALARLNRLDEALLALEMSTKVGPTRSAPYCWLSQISKEQLNDSARAAHYRELGRQVIHRRRTERRQVQLFQR
jgi:tetratricopeptide (TPR) repeat protein